MRRLLFCVISAAVIAGTVGAGAQAPAAPHMYTPQALVTPTPQPPCPSQLAAVVCDALVAPFVQLALRHDISAAG